MLWLKLIHVSNKDPRDKLCFVVAIMSVASWFVWSTTHILQGGFTGIGAIWLPRGASEVTLNDIGKIDQYAKVLSLMSQKHILWKRLRFYTSFLGTTISTQPTKLQI